MENQWQPMETAPKDGSKFLIFITGIEYKKYKNGKKYNVKKIKKIAHAEYWSKWGNFFAVDLFGGGAEIDGLNFKEKEDFKNYGHDIQATHWMPLPKPPVINN